MEDYDSKSLELEHHFIRVIGLPTFGDYCTLNDSSEIIKKNKDGIICYNLYNEYYMRWDYTKYEKLNGYTSVILDITNDQLKHYSLDPTIKFIMIMDSNLYIWNYN